MILCGTDFSRGAQSALLAAVAVARKQDRELLIAHVLEQDDPGARAKAVARLAHDAKELTSTFAVSIDTAVVVGEPVRELLELARQRGARLVVLGVTGSDARRHPLGLVAEHLCQRADLPVLVVREAANLVAWSGGKIVLRALVGSGLGDASRSALACVNNWPEVAVTVAHVAWPYGEHYRLGLTSPIPQHELLPEVHRQLLGDLAHWALEIPCHVTPKLSVIAGWSRIDFHLKQLVEQNEADVLVLGIHQRNISDNTWQSSVSRSALQEATCNVLCVPERYLPVRTGPVPRVVVVPTDFSPLSDRAIGVAGSLLALGGALHLVHVTHDEHDAARAAALARLQACVPKDASIRRITSELRVLHGQQPWIEIWRHAERARADFICMAAHSRDAGPGPTLGSQTKSLLQHSQVPVVLVPPDREG